MNTNKNIHLPAPARRNAGLRIASVIMLVAMLFGLLPAQPAAASPVLSGMAERTGAQKAAPQPIFPEQASTLPIGAPSTAPTLADYPPPQISKTDDPDPVGGTAPLTYTLLITNPLSSPIGGFIVTDTLPAGVAYISAWPSQGSCGHNSGIVLCSLGNLPALGNATIDIHVTSPSTPGIITNLAEVIDARGEPFSTTQQTMVMAADLSITKTDLTDPALWNEPLEYAISVTNNGPFPAQNVTVVDTLPAGAGFTSASPGCSEDNGVVTCAVGALDVGASANLSIIIQAPPGNIRNQALVSALNPDPDPENNLAEAWTAVQPIDLVITKHADPAFVLAGDPLTYTLVVTNQSSLIAPSVIITDRLPAEVAFISASAGCIEAGGVVTCSVGNLNPGASTTRSIVVTPNALPPDGPLYSLQYSQGVLFTLNPLNGAIIEYVYLQIPGDVIDFGGGMDLDPTTGILYAVLQRRNDPNQHRWLVTVDPENALATPIADTQAAGHIIMDITFDDDGTLWAVTGDQGTQPNALVQINKTTGAVTWVMNTGGTYPQTIAWNPDDGLLYNMYGSAVVALQTILPQPPYTTTNVPILGSPPNLSQPGSLEYDINDKVFLMGELASPQDYYRLFADGRIEDRGDLQDKPPIGLAKFPNAISNLAVVSSAGAETNPADNQAEIHTTVDAPELVITKTDDPAHVQLSAPLTYTLLIENINPYTATGVLLTDTLPAGVTFDSATATQGPCSHAGGIVTCNLGTIPPYSDATVVIVVTSPGIPGTITNQAEVVDDRIAYAIDLEDTLVEPVNLILTKTDDSDPTEGHRPLTYTLTIHNDSPYTASGVVVTDTLPLSAHFLKATPSQGPACTTFLPYYVRCELGDIAPYANATIDIGVSPQFPGPLYNEAMVSSTNTELIPADNEDAEDTLIVFPQLAVDITNTPDPADPSSPLAYVIDVSNISIYTALGVVLKDTLAPEMLYGSVSTSQGGPCTQVDTLVTCPLGTIGPAASALVTITVTTPITPGLYLNTALATDDRFAYALEQNYTAVAPADLTIIKYDDPEPATIGSPLTYTLVITNSGPYDAQNVIISDTLPSKVVFYSAESSQGSCTHADSVVTCAVGTVLVSDTASVEIVVTPIDIPPPGMLYSAEYGSSYFRMHNPDTGAWVGSYLQVPGYNVFAISGVDFDPLSQNLYGIALIGTIPGRPDLGQWWLIEIDAENTNNIIGTPIANTQQSGHVIVDMTFDEEGTLWAVTGSEGTTPQSLVTVNRETGFVNLKVNTGAIGQTQAIAYNPDNGLLYNMQAWRVGETWFSRFQTIDPLSWEFHEYPFSGVTLHFPGALEYDLGQRNLLLGGFPQALYRVTTQGVATQYWSTSYTSDGYAVSSPVLNNYAYVSALNPDLSPRDNTAREPTEPLPHPQAASLGNRVWEDLNGNGIQDAGEPGISGVTVQLHKVGWGPLNTITTDANGEYLLPYLIPGASYTITFALPPDYFFTPADQGGDDDLDSDVDSSTGVSPMVTPGNNAVITNLDAGMYRLTSVGDRVWNDTDNNGIQNINETGLAGIIVELYNSSDTRILTTTTDSEGYYTLADLYPGEYRLSFLLPDGYGFSPQNQGGPTIDSDADPYGNTALFLLSSGTPDLTRDAGAASHAASDIYHTITPNPVDEGGSVELTGGYYDPDFGDIYNVTVNWGDGASSPAVVSGVVFNYVFTATHTYTDGDEVYVVEITIEDQFGNSYTEQTSLSATNIAPSLTLSGAAAADEGITYTLSLSPVTDPGTDTLSGCSLDWGDGTPADECLAAIGSSITHVFPDGPQAYTVTVDLEDEDGYYALVDSMVVTIANVAPVGVEDTYVTGEDEVLIVTAPGVLENDLDVPADLLTASIQSGPAIGDLTFNADGSFIYSPPQDYHGTIEFTYRASDGLAWSGITTVTILVGPVNDPPLVIAGEDQNGSEGASLSFSGAYTDLDLHLNGRHYPHTQLPTILWEFGDGETASGVLTPTHAYGDNGIYTVTLTVTDELGGIGSDSLVVTVLNVAPALNPLPDLIAAPQAPISVSITFADPGWLDTHTITVTWGDSQIDVYPLGPGVYAMEAGHTYAALAVYTVTVAVQDDDGATHSQQFAITVRTPRTYLPMIMAK